MTQAATQPSSDLTYSPLHETPLSLSKILAASVGSSSPISTPIASISLRGTWTGMLSNLLFSTSHILICCCLSGARYLPSLMADLLFGYEIICPPQATRLSYKTLSKVYARQIFRQVLIHPFIA